MCKDLNEYKKRFINAPFNRFGPGGIAVDIPAVPNDVLHLIEAIDTDVNAANHLVLAHWNIICVVENFFPKFYT